VNLTNKEAKPYITLWWNTAGISGHECSQMSGVFYHSIIHGLGFFICFMV